LCGLVDYVILINSTLR